jgi:pilus assembly protein Flp/PilA
MIYKVLAWIYCDRGATAIEYGLIAGGISLAIVAAVFLLGDDLQGLFEAMGEPMPKIADEVE